jgi:hypothetical protein
MKYDTKMVVAEIFFSLGSFIVLSANVIIWCYFFGVLE